MKNVADVIKEALSKVDEKEILKIVEHAAFRFIDNDQRREWAVKELVALGLNESIARLVLEVAVQLLKLADEANQ